MSPPAISCRALTKRYQGHVAVDHVDLTVPESCVLAVLGPSGCGKTTLLRLIAGFEAPDEGTITVGDRTVVGPGRFVPPEGRRVGMVFQDYALFPHLDVARNVAFGLPRSEPFRIAEVLNLVGLSGLETRLPHELSGGEQQRVALARALAPRPTILLLDEPFSNLDASLRKQVRADLKEILQRAGATALFVTHDQDEAFFLGDRLAVMNQGRIEQVDTPEVIFQTPASPFVARFLGVADFLLGQVERGRVHTEIGTLSLSNGAVEGSSVHVMVRPDDLSLAPQPGGNGVIVERTFKGTHYLYRVLLNSGHEVHAMTPHATCMALKTPVAVAIDPGHDLVGFVGDRPVRVIPT